MIRELDRSDTAKGPAVSAGFVASPSFVPLAAGTLANDFEGPWECHMLRRDHLASRNIRLDRPNAPGLGSAVVAFRPIGTTNRSPFRQLGMPDPSHSTAVEADIIPLQPRRLAARTHSAASPVMVKYTRTDVSRPVQSVASEDDHRQRMFENLVVVAWVGTLLTAAFYVYGKLLGIH